MDLKWAAGMIVVTILSDLGHRDCLAGQSSPKLAGSHPAPARYRLLLLATKNTMDAIPTEGSRP